MIEFLKPTKAKIIGTALLWVVDTIAVFISESIGDMIFPSFVSAEVIEMMVPSFMEALDAMDPAALLYFTVISITVEIVFKLVFYYIALSLIIEKLVKK